MKLWLYSSSSAGDSGGAPGDDSCGAGGGGEGGGGEDGCCDCEAGGAGGAYISSSSSSAKDTSTSSSISLDRDRLIDFDPLADLSLSAFGDFAGDFVGDFPLPPGDFGDLGGGVLAGDFGAASGVLGLRSWYSTGGDAGRGSGEALRPRTGDLDGERGGVRAGDRAGDLAGDFGGFAADLVGDCLPALPELDPERSLAPALAPALLADPDDARLETERSASLLKLCDRSDATSSGIDEVETSLLGAGAAAAGDGSAGAAD
jgi:hypothetical protein